LPHPDNRPSDIRAAFHTDNIQAIISRYAQEPFEVGVAFATRDGLEHAVLIIENGVTAPVVVRRDLLRPDQSKLLGVGDVWFTTLNANGIPSTARARPEDWRAILDICFQNREADIGQFLRRHLAGQNLAALLSELATFGNEAKIAPTLCERAKDLLRAGESRWR
jgi:hypothetical protein